MVTAKRIEWKCFCGEWVANCYLSHVHAYIDETTGENKTWTVQRQENDETREI